MKIRIEHEIPGRIRFSTPFGKLSDADADLLLYYLRSLPEVTGAKVYQRSGNASVAFTGDRTALLRGICRFSRENSELQALVPEHTSRSLNNEYQNKLANKVLFRLFRTVLPTPVRTVWTCFRSVRYLREGLQCLWQHKLEVPVLDATAIGVSMLRRDFSTASSVMFLLGIGEIMEEWTHKKSVADLAGSMSLGVDKVWLHRDETDLLVPISQIREGDAIRVSVGSTISLDGTVLSGEGMVNQASLTGESLPVRKTAGSTVYAGTGVEEGELLITVRQTAGSTRYERIIRMIEDSERLKSGLESKASHLADQLVPYSFLGTILTYLLTRNVQKAVSILMVDYSCALKLSMPVAVLSAMRECSDRSITVKGGKFMEAVAEADTLVFDKTGTLTRATPTFRSLIPFGGRDRDEMLRIAACLEEHFPHSIATAVVTQAEKEGLQHEEMHTKVQYIIAHGISSEIDGQQVCIGSHHFLFEDEHCVVPEGEEHRFASLPEDCSHLYMSIGGVLAAVICIEDPLRPEAPEVIRRLRELGISNIVMMTGDSERTTHAIARRVGVDHYCSEVLPEDKAAFVQQEQAAGRRVIMVGDGINDSPALSAADAGIAMSDGSQLAREIADITMSRNSLQDLVTLKEISNALIGRIHSSYRFVMGFNSGLILLGLAGVLPPSPSAFLHNFSTLGLGLHNMTDLLEER